MKRKTIYLCCITAFTLFVALPPEKVTAQNKLPYNPLVVENAHWEVGFYSTENPIWAPYQMYQYVIFGDSLLNGIQYKKLYRRDLDDVDPEYLLSEELHSLIREDTLNRKVYAITFVNWEFGCPDNEEYQLYDFDLEVGDTTNLCFVGTGYPWIIYDIVYETLFGKERKKFSTYNSPDYLIEGVGTNYGLFEWGYFAKGNGHESKGGWYELLSYCIGTDEECGYLWVGLKYPLNPYGFNIFPNPLVGNKLYLRCSKPLNEKVKFIIYNTLGSEVYESEYFNLLSEITIELPSAFLEPRSTFIFTIQKNSQPIFKQLIIN